MVLIASVPGLVVAYLLHLYMHENDTSDSVFTRHILTYLHFHDGFTFRSLNHRDALKNMRWVWIGQRLDQVYQKGSHCYWHDWWGKQRAIVTRRLAT